MHYRNYDELDRFRLLPSELIMIILACLPSRDVCNVRLASRYIADLSPPNLFDQRFWSTRFDPDAEMGFVFTGPSNPRPIEPADWRSLYFKAKAALKSELFCGLRNRSRVWNILRHISDALYVILENEQWTPNSSLQSHSQPPPLEAVSAEAAFGSGHSSMGQPLLLSCRLIGWQSISWPQSLNAAYKKIRISSVFFRW
ncbi:uncharacterized protein F4822DRAFT_122153 [Hypoxylon trugodes]|uniref:uncharacterized protein n=1 Tax=Hypoxylon trugodes TaxID=326681 RepID=UPI00218DE94F|nr:uncharacterized protein F4822DRAFT_122153 [Hypoxylon trugodes]KAI1392254.1 hypothetical protein F4822DRAFT_122153 [Hypoxylon trugodes]